MKTIAVLGANGRLANEVVKAFHQQGYQVIAVTRTGRVRDVSRDVLCRVADAMNQRQLKKAVRGADIIFNGLNPTYTQWSHLALPMARHVIAAARSTQAVHLFPGNLYNYGEQIPENCDENTPFHPSGIKGRTRAEMEKLFDIAARKQGVQTLILRAGDFYGGSGRGSWFDLTLVDKIESGQFVYPGDNTIPHAWAYLPDLAKTFVKLVEKHEQLARFEQFVFPGHNLTGAGLQNVVEQVYGRSLKPVNFPWRLINMAKWLVPMWREVAEVSWLWFKPHRLEGRRLQDLLGELPETEPETAVREALVALRKLK